MTVCIVVKLLNQGLFFIDVKERTVLSPFINFSLIVNVRFQRHLLAGTDRRSVLSFLLRGKRKVCVLPDNKFLRNLHSSKVMKRRASEFLFLQCPQV